MSKTNIFITGVGGQGSLMASKIIARAAMNAGQTVLVSEVHGMAQRGGVVESTVKIGDVHSPILLDGDADILIGFELSETLRALRKVSAKTTILTGTDMIVPITVSLGKGKYPDPKSAIAEIEKAGKIAIPLNLVDLANQAGNVIAANIVMIGALAGSGLLPFDEKYLKEAMESSVPERALEVNRLAYKLGRDTVRNAEVAA